MQHELVYLSAAAVALWLSAVFAKLCFFRVILAGLLYLWAHVGPAAVTLLPTVIGHGSP